MQIEIRCAAAGRSSNMMRGRFDRRGFILVPALVAAVCCLEGRAMARGDDVLIVDDFSRDDLISALSTPWRGFSDQVMGGISKETIALAEIDGRRALRLTGDVQLALLSFDPVWDELFSGEQARILQPLVDRIDVYPDRLDLQLRVDCLQMLVADLRVGKPERRAA